MRNLVFWPAEQKMILAHEMNWRRRHPHSSLQQRVIPWLSSFTEQLQHEEINVCASDVIYMTWMLELKAHCIQVALNTVIKSDPLLTKSIMCPGKEGARLSRHPEYRCTHTGYVTTTTTKLHPLKKAQLQLAAAVTLSLNCIRAKTIYMLHRGWEEKN